MSNKIPEKQALYRNGFENPGQEQRMRYVYQERFWEPLPEDWWHPRDFYSRFLDRIPVGERSRYYTITNIHTKNKSKSTH